MTIKIFALILKAIYLDRPVQMSLPRKPSVDRLPFEKKSCRELIFNPKTHNPGLSSPVKPFLFNNFQKRGPINGKFLIFHH